MTYTAEQIAELLGRAEKHNTRASMAGSATLVWDLAEAVKLLVAERDKLAVEREWQPIETAPKDRRILLAKIVGHHDHPTALWWVVIGEWSERWQNWNDGIEPAGLAGPTHWRDLSAKRLRG